MTLRSKIALARQLPPGALARRVVGAAWRRLATPARRRRDFRDPTYAGEIPEGALLRLIEPVPVAALLPARGWIARAAARHAANRFDLLGSGWHAVAHGLDCPGFEDRRYPAGPVVAADAGGDWLAGRINAANLPRSRQVWRLVDPGYRPIDWQLDIRSGYRWREDRRAADAPIGHPPGSDIKLPWELARMQHLPILAWAYALARQGAPGLLPAETYRAACRNQILDFIATNPPRFGVNWRAAMEVAIRAANWVVAHDLFRGFGAVFDDGFTAALKAGLVEHGRHIAGHLEIYPEGRGNHYLADVAGLCFIAAALPRAPESDAWLAFAVQELSGETAYQFGADGASFEGSTSYHRLAAEMVTFASALVLGLPAEKKAAIREADDAALRTRPRRPLAAAREPQGPAHFARVAAMAAFTAAATKPNGRIVQIGDNDSGRFLKPHPIFAARDGDADALDEQGLDHRPLVAAIAALLGRSELVAGGGEGWLDAALVAALSRGQAPPIGPPRAPVRAFGDRRRLAEAAGPHGLIEIAAPGASLRAGLRLEGFPDFGLWIFRSRRLFLALRCGALGYGGRGAHDHNDQLAIELMIDGEEWITDPGSYVYTASRRLRNAYRSVQAHFAPRDGEREPGRLDLGDFWLTDAKARCLAFDADGFIGEHSGFGRVVRREVAIGEDMLTIRDSGLPLAAGAAVIRCAGKRDLAARFPPSVPFSPGYGKRCRNPPTVPA